MSPEPSLQDLFNEALERADAVERALFLDEACGADAALRQRIERLLHAHAEAGGFLSQPSKAPSSRPSLVTAAPPLTERPGDRIGRYKLLQQIGEGGCGVVYLAEQEEPVRRQVALKVIKLGMDTREVIARFDAERQALALMDHPNIARVFDAGATETGRPYFVMELVRGSKITEFCDENKLSTADRLELFMQVCQAIQHAHQKGVIHRDIKPSNILVTVNDGPAAAGCPKVIDFGIAKATAGRLTDRTLFTAFEQFIGTPAYMSPEQAVMTSLDIDTRSDIYSLGVLLYELLTGGPPFEQKELLAAGLDGMRRTIREQEPPRPSARLSTMAAKALITTAQDRQTEPPRLVHLVRGDLDWIVMKALEKDRTRRYETANALAQDVRRFLADEPVTAAAPSALYQFRKFARRNRTALRAAAGLAVVLVAATVVSALLAVRATRAERLAVKRLGEVVAERDAKEAARKAATTAEKLAQDRLTEVAAERDAKEKARQDAEAISTFLSEVFQSPDPARDGRLIKVVELLEAAARKLQTELAGQPGQRARLQSVLGETYQALGLHREAITLQEMALAYHRAVSGPSHPDTVTVMSLLATSCIYAGRFDEALRLLEELQGRVREAFGPGRRGVREEMRLMNNLANLYHEVGRKDEARKIYEDLLPRLREQFGPEHLETIPTMHNLAYCYAGLGRPGEALRMQEEVLALRRKVHGPEHPETLGAMHNLAMFYHDAGRHAEEFAMTEQVLKLRRQVLGPEHPDTVKTLANLAAAYSDAGVFNKALDLQKEVLSLYCRVSGPEHPDALLAMSHLAEGYRRAGFLPEARTFQESALAAMRRALPRTHPSLAIALQNMAYLCELTGREGDAAALRLELADLQRKPPPNQAAVATRGVEGAGGASSLPKPLPDLPVVATLVPPDSEWKWLHPTDGADPAGTDPDFHATFFSPDYDDASWKSGRDSRSSAWGFGYGYGFKGVDIGRPENKDHRRTAYFRHRFTTHKVHARLELRCQRDDGIIVYLDGKEVLRENLPDGPDAHGLFATQPQDTDNDGVIHRFPLAVTLEPGQHILAISLHNANPPSSDLRLGSISLVETGTETSPR